ncbi:MAG TPA: DUF4157 domain-containing protein [Candidatus Angelobacter sp.]
MKDDTLCCERYGRCLANAPVGQNPCRDAWDAHQSRTSDWTECNAYYVERNCLLDIVNKQCKGGVGGLDENCCAELQQQLTFVDQKSNQHCPNATPFPCPFAEDGSIMKLSTTPNTPNPGIQTPGTAGSPTPSTSDSSTPQSGPSDATSPPPSPQRLSRKCACGGEAEYQQEENRVAARESASGSGPATSHDALEQVLRSPGQPLDAGTRAFFEPRFGHDFSNVRVHTDSVAGESALAINAHAFTTGSNVAFAPGKFNPHDSAGRQLLAHELTHTIQQGAVKSLGANARQSEVSGSKSDIVQRQDAGGGASGGQGPGLLGQILSALNNRFVGVVAGAILPGFGAMIQPFVVLLNVAWDVYQNPDKYLSALQASLGGLVAKAGDQARAAVTAAVKSDSLDCVLRHLEPKLAYMAQNWWEVLKSMGMDLLWPWPGVAEDFSAIWRLLQDMWDNLTSLNFNAAGDDATAILRHLNAAAGRVYGWLLLASVLIGAIIGAVGGAAAGGVGAIPGAVAGAAAGLEFAGSVGYVLLISTIAIEGVSILKAAANLARDDRTDAQKECDCEVIASSGLTLGITAAMAILGALASRFARFLIQRFGSRVWRLPARRPAGRITTRTRRLAGRQGQELPEGPQARGDVAEARVALAETVRNIFRRQSVTITDAFSTADNLPGIDFAVDSQIQLRSQTTGNILQDLNAFDDAIANGERVEVTVRGGRVFQVKSHGPVANIVNTIDSEIRNLSNFNTGTFNRVHTAIVTNPAQRVLVEFLQQPLSAADAATLQARAAAANVTLQIVTSGFPPGHPAVVPFEQLPSILPELAQAAPRTVPQTTRPGSEGPGTVVCDVEHAPDAGSSPQAPGPSTPTPSPSAPAPSPAPSPSPTASPSSAPSSAPAPSPVPVAREAHHGGAKPQSLLSLQQQAGNQAVQHLLRNGQIQAKLAMSGPGDPQEQEADQVADHVMRSHAGASTGPCTCAAGGGMCEECQHKRQGVVAREADVVNSATSATLQRKCSCGTTGSCGGGSTALNEEQTHTASIGPIQRSATGPPQLSDPMPMVDRALQSPGSQLDSVTQDFMESRFRHDFGSVQIHTDDSAARSAEAINARAYTAGNHVVFGRSQYSPDSQAGRHLLAHELTHVLQQGSGKARPSLQRQNLPAKGSGSPPEGAPSGETDVPSHTAAGKSGDPSSPSSPVCPHTPTGLGAVAPSPPCVKKPTRDIGFTGRHYHFCNDSDVLAAETPASIAVFVGKQASDATYTVHGYASQEGAADYNRNLACHRANRMATLLAGAGVSAGNLVEVASKGPTSEFPGGPEFNRVAVVLAEVPPERRFGQFRPDPACPKAPTNLGNVQPDPPCPEDPRNLGEECKNLGPNQGECTSSLFCLDSDIFASPDTSGEVMKFARNQPATAHFSVQGFASDEGKGLHDYNVRLSCHRATRLARELMKVGVPSEQIDLAAKGPTTQFGGPEANRVGVVRVRFPSIGPTPKISPKSRMTPEEKHAIVDLALARINAGAYLLGADAYISFWSCARVPTVRHAVNTTHWYVEGDPGIPTYQHYPFTTDPPTSGEAGGRLGLNAAVISDDVFYDRYHGKPGTLEDVMVALTYLSFFDKVSDEDFGTDRKRGSERDEAATYLAMLGGSYSPGQDPRKDKPAPKCMKTPGPTYKGVPSPGEVGHTVPTFEVNESGFRGGSGATVFISPLQGDKGSMETDGNALSANAKVTLHGDPQEFQNYDIGYILTIVEDHTDIAYRAGENVSKGLPVPLRDTDGLRPIEPWYSDGAFETAKPGHVEVSMSKAMAEEMALHFQAISGDQQNKPGSALESADRHSNYQLWLVARRHGAPMDRFSTHFLSGTLVDFTQNLDASGKSPSGKFKTSVPFGGADSSTVRLSGPTPQDLGAKETTTSNVISPCTVGFGKVKFEVDNKDAKAASGAVLNRVPMNMPGKPPGLSVRAAKPVDYQPVITMRILDPKAEADKFEVGLIQNLMEYDWQNHYSTGDVVFLKCTQALPLRDSDDKAGSTDDVFMTDHEPELAQLSLLRRQAKLKLSDVPGGDAMLNLADNPSCPGRKSGTLSRIIASGKFRTWVAVRFNKDQSCLNFLHRIDWTLKYEVTANPDTVVSAELTPQNSDDTGSPAPTLNGLANRDCGSDYSGPCK